MLEKVFLSSIKQQLILIEQRKFLIYLMKIHPLLLASVKAQQLHVIEDPNLYVNIKSYSLATKNITQSQKTEKLAKIF